MQDDPKTLVDSIIGTIQANSRLDTPFVVSDNSYVLQRSRTDMNSICRYLKLRGVTENMIRRSMKTTAKPTPNKVKTPPAMPKARKPYASEPDVYEPHTAAVRPKKGYDIGNGERRWHSGKQVGHKI